MLDCIYMLVVVGFFGLCAWVVVLLKQESERDRLQGRE